MCITCYWKYLTWGKCLNFLKLRLSYRLSALLKVPFVAGRPAYLQVEPVNYCNLRCTECPAGNGTLVRTKKAMSFAVYRRCIDECAGHLLSVLLYFQGEPFLHECLPQMVKYAHERKIFTYTSTNGHFLLDNVLVEALVKSGLDHLVVSVDGTTQEVYEKYRRGGNLQKVVDGISNLVRIKAQLHSVTPFVEVQMVVTADNEHQTDDFEKMFARKGVQKVSLKSAQIYDFEKGSPLIPKNDKYSRYEWAENEWRLKGDLRNRCWKHWSSMVITSAGDMVPCCFDKNAAHAFGNIESGTLYKIWKSKAAQHFRKALLQHRKDIDICRNCSEV